MTPTAQIAAIRSRSEDEFHDRGEALGDVRELLRLWDTHQSALRALVAQWKQEAVIADATCNDTIAVQLRDCAAALERLLESEP